MKEFNIEGACIKEEHYMVDILEKIEDITRLIEKGKYFTINKSRQFGKTTTLAKLAKSLEDKYIVLKASFEGTGESLFENEETFCSNIFQTIAENYKFTDIELYNKILKYGTKTKNYNQLNDNITWICMEQNKEIVLLIDEIDQASNNVVFLKFLGVLRKKYLIRDEVKTFKSVILAGVHDIKSLKLLIKEQKVITADEAKEISSDRYNSPWNIAADFKVDMTFNKEEISTMLNEYEKDHNRGMDIEKISKAIYKYTNGYPFLVSKMCKVIDEDLDKNWTIEVIEEAVKIILEEQNTLFESLIKNLENDKDLYRVIEKIILDGEPIEFNLDVSYINKAVMYGILTKGENKRAEVNNKIFELRIYNYMIVKRIIESKISLNYESRSQFIQENGDLNIIKILDKFQELMKEEYREETEKFKERDGRLIFLAFIKPIINGTGFYYVEAETRTNKRFDIVITYNKKEYIIELKKYYDKPREEKGHKQLAGYLEIKNMEKGYMVVFDFRKNKEYTNEWIEVEEKKIYEVVV